MSRWATATLGELVTIVGGGTPTRSNALYYGGAIPWVTPKDMKSWEIRDAQIHITEQGLNDSATRLIPANSVLVVVRSGILKHTLPVALNRAPVAINQDIKALLCNSRIDSEFLARFIKSQSTAILQWVRATTADNFPVDKLRHLTVPLPPVAEQRRIAKILDKADAMLAMRGAVLAQLDALTQSIFLDMFGDPAANPRQWDLKPLGSLATKFSDGPFGSNLKTEHYTESGIRVIRLQNIGVGEFIDNDAAYIDPLHFDTLKKHECVPGDVLVGTLGAPNLRACIQPEWLSISLNKADCVQIRPDERMATAAFICNLLNQPSTQRMASDLMHGQTRVRISMGRLREMHVPVPPVTLQREFTQRIVSCDKFKLVQRVNHTGLLALFTALQHRAFRGEL